MSLFSFYIPEWVFVAFNFLVLVVVLRMVLWKPVLKLLDERRAKVAQALEDAELIEEEKRGMDARRKSLDEELDLNTADQMKEARFRAGREYDRIVADAESKARAIIASAQVQAAAERENMLVAARAEISEAALAAAEALLRAGIDEERNKALIHAILTQQRGISG